MKYEKVYLDIIFKINNKCSPDSIVHFDELPERATTQQYAHFIYENITDDKTPFQISPFELSLLNVDYPNALAVKRNNRYMIIIHLQRFEKLEMKITSAFPGILKDPHSTITQFAEKAPIDVGVLMYQFIPLFTYYHELAHLNPYQTGKASMQVTERYELPVAANFDDVKHAMEIEADYSTLSVDNKLTYS